jgi:DNA-binding response OmpR family regulator
MNNSRLHIIEDSEMTLYLLKKELSNEYSISTSRNKDEFLSFLKKNITPEIYLIDITLPDIDGFEILQILKNNPSAKIIYSSTTDPDLIEKAFKLGAHDFIKKPTPIKELRTRLSKTLQFQSILQDSNIDFEEVKGTVAHYFGQPLTALGAELYTLKKLLSSKNNDDTVYSSVMRIEKAFDILVDTYNKFKDLDTPTKVNYLNDKEILDLYGDR